MIDGLFKLNTAIYYLFAILALALTVAKVFGRPIRSTLVYALAWIAPFLLLLRVVQFLRDADPKNDFHVFWFGGMVLLSGRNPYPEIDQAIGLPFLSPPSTFPVFAFLGLFPNALSYAIWLGVNLPLALGFVALSRQIWNRLQDNPMSRIGRFDTVELATAVLLSACISVCFRAGQLGIFVAFMATLSVLFLVERKPILAGLALLGASFKPQTMIPFLILFVRRETLATWAVVGVGWLGSMLLFCPPQDMAQWTASWLDGVNFAAREGAVNDFSFRNAQNASIISFSVALDCLGFRDRRMILIFANSLVVLIGLVITFEVAFARRLSSASRVSLVACYSMLFMYHRGNHDSSVLVFPLIHACYLASTQVGAFRQIARFAAIAILMVMNMAATVQNYLFKVSWSYGFGGWLIRAFIVPYSIWILSALLVFFWTVSPREPGRLQGTEHESTALL